MLSDGGCAFRAERLGCPDGTVHILVTGAVDAVVSGDFMDVLIGHITPGGTVVVDLGSATHVDDTGMAALAIADRIAVLHGGKLRVHGCSGEAAHRLRTIKSGLVYTGRER